MSIERLEDDLKDVDLCYKGLGIPFDSPPEEVERAYRFLTEKIKKDQLSSDPAKRKQAGEEAELINALYEKIRNSINYQRKLRERSYDRDAPEGERERKTAPSGPKVIMKICPSCNNAVNSTFKVCPICKKRIYKSNFEKICAEYVFSKKMLFVLTILASIAFVAMIALNYNDIVGFFS